MKSPSSETTGEEKKSDPLRWIIVLPAAVLGGFAAAIVASLAMTLVSESWPNALVTELARGAAIVIVGAKSAPRSRLATAFVLAGVWTALSLTMHVLLLRDSLGMTNYMAAVGT